MTPQAAIFERAQYLLGLVVREEGDNTGDWVDAIINIGGGTPGGPWCARFVSAVMRESERVHGVRMDGFRASGAARHYWQRTAEGQRIDPARWSIVRPGDVFIRSRLSASTEDVLRMRDGGKVQGHTGIVVGTSAKGLLCIAGNSSGNGHSKVPGSGSVAFEMLRPGEPAWLRLVGFARFWAPSVSEDVA